MTAVSEGRWFFDTPLRQTPFMGNTGTHMKRPPKARMNLLFLKVAAPALLIGLALSAACLTAAWFINRNQREMARLLPVNVMAVEEAQRLEIQIRELRFLLLQQRLRPTPSVRQQIEIAHNEIERALAAARSAARDDEQQRLIEQTDREFRTYLIEAETNLAPFTSLDEASRWADNHPVAEAAEPCRELLNLNNREMRETVAVSGQISRWVQAGLILFCILGPIGGFVGGFGTARGMHHSISRMLVLVRDVHAQLEEEVGLLEVDAAPSLDILDDRLQRFVERVKEATHQIQQQQQEILRAEQLAAVGQLAAGVAHEIRNPLMGIKLLIECALRAPNRAELSTEDLAVIYREILRLERTAQGLLDFARPPQIHPELADVRQAILQAVELARPRARQQEVEVEVSLPEDPVMARHDPDQVAGVVTNLILNALDALPHGGKVRVGLGSGPGGEAQVTVEDTGTGLASDILPRLFVPFTSTKPTGTGLGLSVSRRIARQHGGDLTAANGPGGGACFTLTLPRPEATDAHTVGRR